MAKKTKDGEYVLNGFRALDAEEKKWLLDEMRKDLDELNKSGRIKEAYEMPFVNLGPLPGKCPCCGG